MTPELLLDRVAGPGQGFDCSFVGGLAARERLVELDEEGLSPVQSTVVGPACGVSPVDLSFAGEKLARGCQEFIRADAYRPGFP